MVDEFKLDKLNKLKEMGIEAYPYSYDRTHVASEITSNYDKYKGSKTSLAGRISGMRKMGAIYFIDLLDASGKIQIIAREDKIPEKTMSIVKLMEAGDIIGVSGVVGQSNTKQTSIELEAITVLAKSLRTMPEKFHGLTDTEIRYRKRYLDMIINPNVRGYFTTRSKVLKQMRSFLDEKGYIEFETPVLQPTYGGANAKPFITHHNALDTDVFLRVADELYLKRLIIGGMEKVYEVSKDFRNEDIDSTHNPEFTIIECYEAYKDYEDYMKMTEELVASIAMKLFGKHKIPYQTKEIDFTPPFKRISWTAEVKKKSGIDVLELNDSNAAEIAKKEKLKTHIKNAYHVADALFDKYVQPDLWNPTFVVDFPAYMCPLAKDKRGNPKLSERFELFIANRECGNSFSELTNPLEQKRKFDDQAVERAHGDDEAPPADVDFIEAIEHGMPPTAGLGISVDRLSMLFTDNVSIKEVIAFPAVRPEKSEKPKMPVSKK